MNKLECKQIDQNIKAGGLEDKERKIDLECSNGSAPKSICFQAETEPQYSFQTCGPFLYHIHRISRRSMLGCNQITHPMPPITLKSCQNEKHYGFFFFVFELAPVHVNVEIDFILNVVTFPTLLPMFPSSVTKQALQAVRTVVYVLFYFSYRLAECLLLILQAVYVFVPLVLLHDLRQRLPKVFGKGTGSKYLRFCRLTLSL